MKNFELMNVQELSSVELATTEGGMNDRPMGTSYDGYPSGGGSSKSNSEKATDFAEVMIWLLGL